MKTYSLSHLADHALLRHLAELVTRDRTTTAELLAHIAEVDARRLYLPAGFPSMHAYCVQELHLSEDATRRRIHAARAARRVPSILTALADGRLHLSGINLLGPWISQENAADLIAAATHKGNSEIEQLLAARFPRLDAPTMVQAIAERSESTSFQTERVPGRVEQTSPGRIESPTSPPRVTPLSPQRFALQLTMRQELHDKLRYAQDLLSHQVPPGDVAAVLERALDALIPQLEKRKFGATKRSSRMRASNGGRYIPVRVRHAVWKRDGGQCAFIGTDGRRCSARDRLEFDHVVEVARGGGATVDQVRLLCRSHNQYRAEQTFGAGFMEDKRREAQRARQVRQEHAAASEAPKLDQAHDVIPYLRALKFTAEEARQAAERCAAIPGAPIEERVRRALGYFRLGTRSSPGGQTWAHQRP